MRTLWLAWLLLAPAAPGQGHACGLVTAEEAAAVVGPVDSPMAVGNAGCSYANRARGVRLIVTVMDLGEMARQTWDGLRNRSADASWLVGGEAGMGAAAYSEVVRRGAYSATGRCGFVAVKGGKVVHLFVSDSAGKADVAGRREMLERLRPVTRTIVERM